MTIPSQTVRNQIYLGLGQLVCHLSFIYVVLHFSLNGLLGSLAIYYFMTSWGTSITAHRLLSHRSFHMPRAFEFVGSLWFTFSLQGSTLAWVAMHREHHKYSDRQGDPHNPAEGLWKTHFLSMFYTPRLRYVVDLLRDPLHQYFHRFYWPLNLAYTSLLFGLGGWSAAVYFHWFPACLCWQGIGVAKTWAHSSGYKNFATGDHSHNIPVMGYLTFGEAWHNNHHAHPSRYSFAHRPHEIDFSGALISFGIKFFGFRGRDEAVLRHQSR